MIRAAMMSSERINWNTPENALHLVYRHMGQIDLDPCSNPESIVKAELALSLENGDNGLTQPWEGRVYVNPPYGREISWWVLKCLRESKLPRCLEIIALLPARTDTGWFEECWKADAICFWKGRLTFLGAQHPAPFPSCLVYWGPQPERFYGIFSIAGKVIFPKVISPQR